MDNAADTQRILASQLPRESNQRATADRTQITPIAWRPLLCLIAWAIACSGCVKSPDDSQSAEEHPTPNPAVASKAEAVKRYPALGRKDSTFNKTFLELYRQKKDAVPDFFQADDWPMKLAQETSRTIAASMTAPSQNTPAPSAWFEQRVDEATHTMDHHEK